MCVSEDRNRKRSSQTETRERERGEPHYHAAEKTLVNAALVFYSTLNLVFMKGRLLVKRLSNHDQLQTAFLRLKYMML